MRLSLLSPPVAFVVLLAVVLVASLAAAGFARRTTGRHGSTGPRAQKQPLAESRGRRNGSYLREPYTGGERLARNQFPPEYAQFFPFAFSFIILHVAVLTIATMPVLDSGTAIAGGLYVVGAAIGFVVLMRR